MHNRMDFKRYELKYLMNESQKGAVLDALAEHAVPDHFGHSSIRNIYLDTDSFVLARRSIEKPMYKEKLRFRCYGPVRPGGDVFVELKKKYDGVVYKRRLAMPLDDAMGWFTGGSGDHPNTQIGREIDFLRTRYEGIRPRMFLSYERDSYRADDGKDLRITIDSEVAARMDDVDLTKAPTGRSVLPDGYTLMEIKTMYGYPEWLVRTLRENGLYKASFSKYGNAYKELVLLSEPEIYRALRRS